MDINPELLKRVAFGPAYGKDKVSRLKRLLEVDEISTYSMQQFYSALHVPRSYIESEFPKYK